MRALFITGNPMCANHTQLIKKSRHRFERPLFALATILTVSIWLIVIALSFAKEETAAIIRQDIVSEFEPRVIVNTP